MIVAYDFETTRIQPGTPRPLYITMYSEELKLSLELPIKDFAHLLWILETYFLTEELYGVKFVAWYGNNFDAYLISAALIVSGKYVLRPYLTRSKALRGLKVMPISEGADSRSGKHWEFLDGAAMLGLATVPLKDFLETFAPHLPKMVGAIDFEKEEFDSTNRKHCDYAMRDSVGLYAGMVVAQQILLDTFNQPLTVTMGGACIKIFAAHIPHDIEIPLPRNEVLGAVHDYVMRGGFCFCVRRYKGPVWKYDINQAYAAAMRDAKLPCGFTTYTNGEPPDNAQVYIARVSAFKGNNRVPFYYRSELGGKIRSLFSEETIFDTWLTSLEIEQLKAEKWKIKWHETYSWAESFNMYEYVSKLETLRTNCEGGPKGATGTMVKMVGCHSYGKTVERLEPIEYVLADECPDDFFPYYDNGFEPLEHVFYRMVDEEDVRPKIYHQPQLGAFITAHVRMVLRRTILLSPNHWLYADTDCVVFSCDMTKQLDIDAARYGAWKIEESGTDYLIIAKKVYTQDADIDTRAQWGTMTPTQRAKKVKRGAKGMNVKKLTPEDFDKWYEGDVPEQEQTQRNNYLKVMQGAEMFRKQLRKGTAIEAKTK